MKTFILSEIHQEKPPPVPPSSPRVSAWDYFNVFDAYNNVGGDLYSSYYTSGRYGYGSSMSTLDSKEVREREGIPDLKDETEQESIKELHKAKNARDEVNMNTKVKLNEELKRDYGEGTSKSEHIRSSSESFDSIQGKGIKNSMSPDTIRSPDSIVSKSPEEGSVGRKGVTFKVEGASNVTMDVDSSKPITLSAHGIRDLQEVVKEIRDKFETAASYGKEVALMLEVGQLPYQCQQRSTLLKVILSMILYLVSSHPPPRPSVQISSQTMKLANAYSRDPGNDFDLKPRNPSSTIQKIYAWEKKLYKEVKDEERLRAMYEKECKSLKALDDLGAEPSKIDTTQASIRKLLTKTNVCIIAVDSISSKIHRLWDEELQSQIMELIGGWMNSLIKMLHSNLKVKLWEVENLVNLLAPIDKIG